ncbi:MAG TPA: quinone oxidoreductase [Steroidobacteraceae bacterium]|nr:quinone oxidoreductase [Steroidobacteraceae bacterium]
MPYAIRIHENGGPEILRYEDIEVPEPGPEDIRVRHTAIGLNFIDVYERTGLYPTTFPAVLGREAAGVVEAVGAKVKGVGVGDRIAYTGTGNGSYSEARILAAARAVKIPDGIDDQQAAAIMLKGLTTQALVRRIYRLRKNEYALIHAAAGGVGLLTVQWAKHLGAKVIAIVGSEEKAALAREHGADHVLLTSDDWLAEVKKITGKKGVHVVYDSVGKDTFFPSLDSLRPRGMMVTFGNASGPAPAFAPLELSKRGSLFLTRPTLFHYIATRPELEKAAAELFDLVERKVLKVHVGQTYALREAAQAHRDLESRKTMGSTVLVP